MLMRKIYTRCQRCLAYLGESDGSTPAAMNLMERIYDAAPSNSVTSNVLGLLDWQSRNHLPQSFEHDKYESLKDFFARPYFSRKWTFQECVLPPKLTFYCGRWEVGFEVMRVVVDTIFDTALPVMDSTSYPKIALRHQLQDGLTQLMTASYSRADHPERMSRHNFMPLMQLLINSRATDLRDHLFALVGVSDDADDPVLRPEYGQATILDNCLRYAWYFLAEKKTLEVLYRAGRRGHRLLAPSWVPNWYGKRERFGDKSDNSMPWSPLDRPLMYHITKGTRVEIDPLPDPTIMRKVLRIKGVLLDMIKDVANNHVLDMPHNDMMADHTGPHVQRHIWQCDALVSSLRSYPTGESLQTALWSTLVCGITEGAERAPPKEFDASYLAWRQMLAKMYNNEEEYMDLWRRGSLFRSAYTAINIHKVLGVTESGYMGMFCKVTQPGDVVAALYGGKWPFILRKHPEPNDDIGDYELIGQCYIHGMMEEGQFDIASKKDQEQWFKLGSDFDVEEPFQPNGQMVSAA
jgi:hypothetical protein